MGHRRVKLTQRIVDAARPETTRYVMTDTEISGFRLYVFPSGRKAYFFRYRVGGGRGATIREPKVGEHPAIRAERARSIAADWTADVRGGGDPGGARQAQRAAPRMTDLFRRYLEDHARARKKMLSRRVV